MYSQQIHGMHCLYILCRGGHGPEPAMRELGVCLVGQLRGICSPADLGTVLDAPVPEYGFDENMFLYEDIACLKKFHGAQHIETLLKRPLSSTKETHFLY